MAFPANAQASFCKFKPLSSDCMHAASSAQVYACRLHLHKVASDMLVNSLGLSAAVICLKLFSVSGLTIPLLAGRRAGLWTVIPCQLIVMIGLDIVYCVTAGRSMRFLYQQTCHGWREHTCTSFGLSLWIVIFAIIQIFLSMVCPSRTGHLVMYGICTCCIHPPLFSSKSLYCIV